jgi:hypothetical protein
MTIFTLVGGTDVKPSAAPPETERLPAQRKRKGPYKQQARKEYQDGLPVIDPAGEEDRIFRHIAEHRAAAAHYDRCVTVENDAEGNVSDNEFSYLQRNTRIAFDQMMLWARSVIVSHAPRPDPSSAIPRLAV